MDSHRDHIDEDTPINSLVEYFEGVGTVHEPIDIPWCTSEHEGGVSTYHAGQNRGVVDDMPAPMRPNSIQTFSVVELEFDHDPNDKERSQS